MKALEFYPGEGLRLVDRPMPAPPPGGLVIKVMAAAICGSDLRILRGEKEATPGVILGHEVAGLVEKSHHQEYRAGQAVAIFPSLFCGHCLYCRRGLTNLCRDKRSIGYRLDGGFAQYMAVPGEMVEEGAVVKLQGRAPWTSRALIEPLACVLHSTQRVGEGESFLILGGGPMGLMHLLVLMNRGARELFLAEVDPKRLKMARELGGDKVVVFSPQEKPLRRYLGRERVDGVFFCARAHHLVDEGLEVLRKGGTLNLFAGYPGGTRATLDPNALHYGERELTGTHSTTLPLFVEGARMVEEGRIDLKPLATHSYPLEKWREAFHTYESREGLKVVFTPHPNTC